jgi:hypothetical protein
MPNKTDVASTAVGLGNPSTTYTYDEVGNKLSTATPLGRVSSTSFDQFNHPLDETAPDGIVTRHVYADNGTESTRFANYRDSVPGNDPAGPSDIAPTMADDIQTSTVYDPFGRVVDQIADDGFASGIKSETKTTYDLFGNALTTTAFGDTAHTDSRVTTNFVEAYGSVSRTKPTGTQSAIDPGAAAPLCPAPSSQPCNTVGVLDPAGRVTDYDLAGKPVQTIVNYIDGNPDGNEPDRDLITATAYTPFGQTRWVRDPGGLTTVTDYDNLARATTVTNYSTGGYDAANPNNNRISSTRTTYTPGGKTRLQSAADDPSKADSLRFWTRTAYDKAGRAVLTLDNVDQSGNAPIVIDDFEDRAIGGGTLLESADDHVWSTATLGSVLTSGATRSAGTDADAIAARTGRGRMKLTTTSSNQGAALTLPGTFASGSAYHARVYARWDGTGTAPQVQALFANSSGTQIGTANTATTLTTSWTALDVPDWPGTAISGVSLVVRQTNASGATWYLDDARSGMQPSGQIQAIRARGRAQYRPPRPCTTPMLESSKRSPRLGSRARPAWSRRLHSMPPAVVSLRLPTRLSATLPRSSRTAPPPTGAWTTPPGPARRAMSAHSH